CWHTGKWDVGTRVPATQRVGIGASRAKSYLLRRIKIVAHLLPSQADRSALHPSSGQAASDMRKARLSVGAQQRKRRVAEVGTIILLHLFPGPFKMATESCSIVPPLGRAD